MILLSYVEQVLTMCRVQEGQLLLLYFRSYFPLIVSDAISCLLHNLNTLWYIIMTFYSYVEEVLTMYHIQEWPPTPHPHIKIPGIDLDSL